MNFRGNTELGDITPHNIKQLKLLNQVVFPVTYNDKFYKDVLEVGELAKLGRKFMTLLSIFDKLFTTQPLEAPPYIVKSPVRVYYHI